MIIENDQATRMPHGLQQGEIYIPFIQSCPNTTTDGALKQELYKTAVEAYGKLEHHVRSEGHDLPWKEYFVLKEIFSLREGYRLPHDEPVEIDEPPTFMMDEILIGMYHLISDQYNPKTTYDREEIDSVQNDQSSYGLDLLLKQSNMDDNEISNLITEAVMGLANKENNRGIGENTRARTILDLFLGYPDNKGSLKLKRENIKKGSPTYLQDIFGKRHYSEELQNPEIDAGSLVYESPMSDLEESLSPQNIYEQHLREKDTSQSEYLTQDDTGIGYQAVLAFNFPTPLYNSKNRNLLNQLKNMRSARTFTGYNVKRLLQHT